jgi:hypothetical protein
VKRARALSQTHDHGRQPSTPSSLSLSRHSSQNNLSISLVGPLKSTKVSSGPNKRIRSLAALMLTFSLLLAKLVHKGSPFGSINLHLGSGRYFVSPRTDLARSKEKVNINAARDLMRLLGLLCLWQFQSLPYIRVCRRRLTILEVPIIFYLRSQ